MKMKLHETVRQGDVLIRRVKSIPAAAQAQAVSDGRLVLAYGEVTGHAHAIAVEPLAPAALLFDFGEELFLRADGEVVLRHEEHAPIRLVPGNYQVLRQVEYAPDELRTVAD